jgi:hypothetical protein
MADLIQALTAEAGLSPDEARRVLQRLLSHVEQSLRQRFGDATADRFLERTRDLGVSVSAAPESAGSSSGTERGLEETLAAILGPAGVDPLKAGIGLPAVARSLKERLRPDELRQVLQVAPFLIMAAPERHPGLEAPIEPALHGQ